MTSYGEKKIRITKLIFPFMTISIGVDDYQVVNIIEGLKYHMRITFFVLKPPGSLRCRHSEKARKMERRKTRWWFLQVYRLYSDFHVHNFEFI